MFIGHSNLDLYDDAPIFLARETRASALKIRFLYQITIHFVSKFKDNQLPVDVDGSAVSPSVPSVPSPSVASSKRVCSDVVAGTRIGG